MHLLAFSTLPALESLQFLLVLACALVNVRTLNGALEIYRDVRRQGEAEFALQWATVRVRGKRCLVAVQALIIAMGIYRLHQAFTAIPTSLIVFTAFGVAHRFVSVLVAWTAYENARAYEGRRDGSQ